MQLITYNCEDCILQQGLDNGEDLILQQGKMCNLGLNVEYALDAISVSDTFDATIEFRQ